MFVYVETMTQLETHRIFGPKKVVPLLEDVVSVSTLLSDSLPSTVEDPEGMAEAIIKKLGSVGCKTALRLAERAITAAARDGSRGDNDTQGGELVGTVQLSALSDILDDLVGDEVTAQQLCEVIT